MNLPEITVVAALIYNSKNQILITLRPEGFHLSGLWEFPGGKVEDGESYPNALIREIKEETNLDINVGDLYWEEKVAYTKKRVHLYFYRCELTREDQQVVCHDVDDYRWVYKNELNDFDFPEADKALIDHIMES